MDPDGGRKKEEEPVELGACAMEEGGIDCQRLRDWLDKRNMVIRTTRGTIGFLCT